MNRGSQVLLIVLLAAVLGMGGLLIARNRTGGTGGATTPSRSSLLAYAPCGMSGPLQQAATLFRHKHPEVPLEVVYDNANILVRRVVKDGERPDVFISPGELELKQVSDKGLIDAASVTDFGTLDMVLIAPRQDKTVNSFDDLKQAKVEAVSLGDPKFNSVGYYGEQALRALGLWDAVEPKLITREYPLEAFKLVEQNQVQAGFAYLTCPLDTAPEKADKQSVRIVQKVPRDKCPPIRLQLGVLKSSTQQAAAKVFIDFMTSKEAQQVMAKDGLLPLEVRK